MSKSRTGPMPPHADLHFSTDQASFREEQNEIDLDNWRGRGDYAAEHEAAEPPEQLNFLGILIKGNG